MAAPFFGFAPPPIQKQNPLEFLVPAAGGLLQGIEKRKFAQDLQNLAVHNQAVQSGQFPGLNIPPPIPQSQQGRQLQGRGLFAAQAPLTQFQERSLEIQEQEARNAGVLTPTQQTAADKAAARKDIEQGIRNGDDVTGKIKNFKTLFGSGQTINVGPGTELTDKQKLELGFSRSKEFNAHPVVKAQDILEKNFKRMDSALKSALSGEGNIANDQTLIQTFNKLLDEASVVRESEFARTPQMQSLLNRIKGFGPKVVKGGVGLTDDERQAIFDAADRFHEIGQRMFNRVHGEFSIQNVEAGLNDKIVFGGRKAFSFDEPPKSAIATPEQVPGNATVITNTTEFKKLRPGTEYIFNNQRFIKGQ